MQRQFIINLKILPNMKKFALTIAAVMIAFVMTSCGGESPKEKIMKTTDEFFTQAENNVQAITSGEDFMNLVADMETKRDELIQKLFGPYSDNDGNIKGISDTDMEEIQSYIYDRATAYNKVEGAKAAEFISPALDEVERYTDELYAQFKAGEDLNLETVKKFDDAYVNVMIFNDYDNVLPELQERRAANWEKIDEMNEVLIAKLHELYPEE